MTKPSPTFTPAQLDRALVWRYIFAGLCASLDSIGLARFAFTPLIPELIQAHWFPASSVIYLGAANLAGYVCGALIGRTVGARLGNERTLRLMMVWITAAFLACAVPLSFGWYFSWRFMSGMAGGVVMVLVAGTILPHVPPARKGAASGAIFLGLGLGIAGSGTLIPLLLQLGLAQTWIGLGILSALLTAASWFAWPPRQLDRHPTAAVKAAASAKSHFGGAVWMLYLQYALMATAAVVPMVFLVDFIARGLGAGTHLGAVFWAIYGLGAIAGPPLYGFLADRLGASPSIRLVSLALAIVLAAVYITDNLLVLGALTMVIGTFAPGMVPLALARVHELVPEHAPRQNIAWSRASILSAAAMAVAGYAYSALFNATGGSHRLLFLTAAALLLVALLADLCFPAKARDSQMARS
ncbi:YbfB/YjiJ family MFS transporter [Cupriavidus gilardii]|uniref:YbfB/YjiJ family MFS transporter n=1 Tax=Cupriavidus gilardii TaxID=82541 RepID=UPI001EE5BFB3|nr:YbfB/YjiJ family MFS transporter [Cupriavidus gilardii]MCG5258750.1 MFS transporter [Cupriavidus gilardii]MDF9429268.1 YbfB/YjiJ family MFS transporter [Cupriavidus gilardii]